MGLEDLSDLAWLLEEQMKGIQERMDLLKKTSSSTSTSTNPTTNHPQLVEDNHQQQQGFGGGGTHQIGGGIHHEHQEEKMGLDLAMEALKKESWFMDVMNSHEHMACGVVGGSGDDYVMPSYYGDSSTWSNVFFP